MSYKVIIYIVLAFIFVVYNIVLFDIGKSTGKAKAELKALDSQYWSLKAKVHESELRVIAADSIAAIEINKLRSDLVDLSKLRELNAVQVKAMQQYLRYEQYKRDSIGSTLIEW